MRRLVLGVIAGVALVGCGAGYRWDGNGQIVKRQYHDAHDETIWVCTTWDPKYHYCTSQIPVTTHYDESWSVKVQTSDGKTHWVNVSEQFFNVCREGRQVRDWECLG